MTPRMQEVLRLVTRAMARRQWYRAGDEGSSPAGQRVTLAYLYKAGLVTRRPWRGADGDADAAYEYRLATVMLAHVVGSGQIGVTLAADMDGQALQGPRGSVVAVNTPVTGGDTRPVIAPAVTRFIR